MSNFSDSHNVYLSPEILKKVLETTRGEALLFLHHPIDMEVSGTGFIAFLFSDDASYITATTIHVDGGRVAH